ncbi:MAG: SAM-dependent methyltransferase, partial [Pseudomonadota bacterium]
ISRIDGELATKKPLVRRIMASILRLIFRKRGLERLDARLRGSFRTSEAFIRNNRYLVTLLKKRA